MAPLAYGQACLLEAGLFFPQVLSTSLSYPPTFLLWVNLKTLVVHITKGYSNLDSPDMIWWEKAKLDNVEYIDVSELNIGSPTET